MTAATLLQPLCFREFDQNGAPLAFGTVQTFQAGTNTPIATYSDPGAITPNLNPLTLNNRGEAAIYVMPNVNYKFLVKDQAGNQIRLTDNVQQSQLITLYGGVDTGSANAYVLTFTANFSSYVDGTVIYWVPANTNSGASTINVNGLGIVNIVNNDGTALTASEIVVNNIAEIIYKGGSFFLINPATLNSRIAYKLTSTDRSSTTTLTADPDLQISLKASSTYQISVFALFTGVTSGAQGIKFSINYSGAFTLVGAAQGVQTVNSVGSVINPTTTGGLTAIATIAVSTNIDGTNFNFVVNTNTAGVLSFNWAQNSSSANVTRVIAGSYLTANSIHA
jgi:hypothetical protein